MIQIAINLVLKICNVGAYYTPEKKIIEFSQVLKELYQFLNLEHTVCLRFRLFKESASVVVTDRALIADLRHCFSVRKSQLVTSCTCANSVRVLLSMGRSVGRSVGRQRRKFRQIANFFSLEKLDFLYFLLRSSTTR